jgi:hypothetical protein
MDVNMVIEALLPSGVYLSRELVVFLLESI